MNKNNIKIFQDLRHTLGFKSKFIFSESLFELVKITLLDFYYLNYKQVKLPLDINSLLPSHRKVLEILCENKLIHSSIGSFRYLKLSKDVTYYDFVLTSLEGGHFSRGTGYDIDEAFARAVGELLERTSLRFVDNEDIIYDSYKNLQKNHDVVDINKFAQRSILQKEKNENFNIDKDSIIGWILANNISDNQKKVYVPAHMIFWGYKKKDGEKTIYPIDTGSLGAGYSFEDAKESAMGESIQRHNFMSYWYMKKTPNLISLDSILKSKHIINENKGFIEAVLGYGFEIIFLNMTGDNGTPSVCCILTKKGLGIWLAMSSNSTYNSAIYRSLSEALSIYTWVMNTSLSGKNKWMFKKDNFLSDFVDTTITDEKRVCMYANEDTKKNIEFLLLGESLMLDILIENNKKSSIDILSELSDISDKNVYVHRADKNKLLEKLGFEVCRAIVPNTYRIALYEPVSNPVLNNINPKNTFPHPFP